LNLFHKLSTLPLFVRYFFNVVDRHSIQAPFAYQFLEKLKQAIRSSKPFADVEHERESLASELSLVKGDDFGAGSKLKESTISNIVRFGISSTRTCIFLHQLANVSNAGICIELGTSLGIATAYLARSSSMKKVYSLEGNKVLAGEAQDLLHRLDIKNVEIIEGNIDSELPILIGNVDAIDLAIIDANHTREALIRYYQLLESKMHDHSILFVDDIRWSRDMYAGWLDLSQRVEVSLSMEFLDFGLLFFEKGIQKQHYILGI
jgi:predicted O-methyltransferase YrrM